MQRGASAPQSGRPLKVLLACQPSDGGVARHVADLSEGLIARGCDVTVACPPNGALARTLIRRDTRVIDLPMEREISPLSDTSALLGFVRMCRAQRPDVVHVHSSKAGFIGRIAGRLAGVPVVAFTPHCWSFQSTQGRKRAFYVRLERFASRYCDMTITVSQAEADEAVALSVLKPERVRVIHNGLSDTELQPAPPRTRDIPFLAVGRLDEQKGYPYLIDAMAELVRTTPDARLTIVGGGSMESQLREQAASLGIHRSIDFAGDRSDVRDYLLRARVFVMSSLWEGLPYAIMEAMAAGIPVVSSDVGGCRELVSDSETGLLVPARDPRALAEAMRKLASDQQLCEQLGSAGAERVRDRFRLDTCIDAVERTYADCLKDR